MRGDRRFDLTDRIIYLHSIPVATGQPTAVLKALASSMRERTFAPGEVLMREG